MKTKKVVLAIDDVSLSLLTIKSVLSEDFNVRVAKSGAAALYILGAVKVDLILLDLEMPDMSGFEFICAVKKINDIKDIPIIIVTSHADEDNICEAFKHGAKDFIVKPINTKIMKEKIFKTLDISPS